MDWVANCCCFSHYLELKKKPAQSKLCGFKFLNQEKQLTMKILYEKSTNCTNTTLLYDRDKKHAVLVVHPQAHWDEKYSDYSSILACFSYYQDTDFQRRSALLMADFVALVVRDGFDPVYLHKVLLPLAEWRSILAPDIEGAHD